MYEVVLSSQACKYFEKIILSNQMKLEDAFEDLEMNGKDSFKVVKVKGKKGFYRYRVNDLRIIFNICEEEKRIQVHLILPRGQVYKNM